MFRTDMVLVFMLPLTLLSGLTLHAANHGMIHSANRFWPILHILSGLLLFAGSLLHIGAHRGWYKSLWKGTGNHSTATCILSIVYLSNVLSGILLLILKGTKGPHWGLFHYQTGILFGILGLYHFFCRMKRLRKLK